MVTSGQQRHRSHTGLFTRRSTLELSQGYYYKFFPAYLLTLIMRALVFTARDAIRR